MIGWAMVGVVVTLARAQEDVDFWLGVAGGAATDAQIREFFCSRFVLHALVLFD